MSSPMKKTRQVPTGFRAPPKPKFDPTKLSERELRDTYRRNENILASSSPSASFVPRLQTEQTAIQTHLEQLSRKDLEDNMGMLTVSGPSNPESSTLRTKRRILASYSSATDDTNHGSGSTFTVQQAMEIERKAHMADLERKQRVAARRLEHGLPGPDEQLTQKERNQRIWAFMNYRPTDSDMEDEDDDEDSLSWLDEEEDESRRNPNAIDPDIPDYLTPEELSNILCVDESRYEHETFRFER